MKCRTRSRGREGRDVYSWKTKRSRGKGAREEGRTEHTGEEARKRWRNRGRGKGRRGEQEGMGSRELKKEKKMDVHGEGATGWQGATGMNK